MRKTTTGPELNTQAINHCIKFLNGLKEHVERAGNWPYDIKGSSILVGVDNNKSVNNCAIRLIDFNSVEKKEEGYLDSGFVKGLETLIEILEEFLNPQANNKTISSEISASSK